MPSFVDWEDLGGLFDSAPAIISLERDRLDIFGLGLDDAVYHKGWYADHWDPPNDWRPLGKPSQNISFTAPRAVIPPSQLDFDWQIVFHDDTPVGGWLHLTLFADGTSRFSGHLRDSGWDSYAASIGAAVIDRTGRAYTFENVGNMWGSDLPGSRDHDWSVSTHVNATLRDNWLDLFRCGGTRFGKRLDLQTFPPGGLVHEAPSVLEDMAPGENLTVVPLVEA